MGGLWGGGGKGGKGEGKEEVHSREGLSALWKKFAYMGVVFWDIDILSSQAESNLNRGREMIGWCV